jgi:hypothetical protein
LLRLHELTNWRNSISDGRERKESYKKFYIRITPSI